jgi:stress-induced-phosphoprotein 1
VPFFLSFFFLRFFALAMLLFSVFYSNRSAAYLQKGDADSALKDAESCIAAKPDWAKGYNRKGCAQHALKQYDEAIATFEAGLKIAPGSALLTGPMKEAQTAQKNAAAAASAGGKTQMPNVFGPDMWVKLQSNPQTAEWLQDPAYVSGLNAIAANPQMMQNPQMIQSLGDQRLLQTFLFLMGMPLNLGQEGGPGYSGPPREDQKVYKQKEPEPEPVKELTEEEKALAATREKGTALKDQGNALFKEKKYKEAIEMYLKAEEADPTLMTYRTNVASCYHAMKEYATAVEECKKALEVGAEHYNDYKLKAKAMERIGNAYWKLEDFDAALEWQDKAQMEIHDDKRYTKIKKWRKQLSKKKAEAYLDPVKALEAKEAGNKCFSAKDFKGAIELYTEAIKRDPTNPAYFCNRCGALQKVMDLEGAKKDANTAIELDPT